MFVSKFGINRSGSPKHTGVIDILIFRFHNFRRGFPLGIRLIPRVINFYEIGGNATRPLQFTLALAYQQDALLIETKCN